MNLSSLLFFLGPALAHRPHDDTPAFAVPADFSTSGRAWAILDPHDISQLLRSDDHGMHWDYICGPTMEDIQTDAGYQGDTLIFVGDEGRIWTSTDEGETWAMTPITPDPVGTNVAAFSDSWGMIGTEIGVYVGDVANNPGGLTRQLAGQRITALAVSKANPDQAWVGTDSGEVHLTTNSGTSFSALPALPGGFEAMSIVEDGDLFVGSNGLGVLRWDDDASTWVECGVLPYTNVGDYLLHIPAMTSADGRLFATNGHEALFYSDDRCETWDILQTSEVPEYGGIGNAGGPQEAFTSVGMVDRFGWVAGFMGVTVTEDEGSTWYETQMFPADYTRGVAFAPDYPEDPRIFIGGYGGGAWWTWDGGATWEGSAASMHSAYSYDVQPADSLSERGTVFFSGSLVTYRSFDGGYTWDDLAEIVPISRVRAYRPYGERTYALGEDQNASIEGQLAWTEDDGDTWYEWDSLYEVLGASAPQDVQETPIQGTPAIVVVADSPPQIVVSTDEGATWERLYAGADLDVRAAGALAWPPETGDRLLFADADSGVMESNDGGQTWAPNAAAPEGVPRDMIMADDGTIYLLVRSGQMYRSEDGGASWQEAGEPIAAAIHDLDTSPNFAKTGTILAGTQNGVFFSADRGDSWQRLHRFQRLEATTDHLQCWTLETAARANGAAPPPHAGSQACAAYEDDAQGLRGGWLMNPGDEVHFSFTGTRFRALGPIDGEGEILVEVNGAFLDSLNAGDDMDVSLEDPDGVWKDVTLTYAGTAQLHLDAVEIWGDGEVIPGFGGDSGGDSGGDGGGDDGGDDTDINSDDTAGDDTGTGGGGGCCDKDGSEDAVLLLLPLVLAGIRRRRS